MHSADFSCLPVFLFGFGRGFRVTTLATLFISYAYFLASGLDLPTLSVMQRIVFGPMNSTLVNFIEMCHVGGLWTFCRPSQSTPTYRPAVLQDRRHSVQLATFCPAPGTGLYFGVVFSVLVSPFMAKLSLIYIHLRLSKA